MRHYQIFPFDAAGRLLDAVACDLENDVRAIRRALQTEFPFGCELWEGFRFIGRFHAPAGASPASEAELAQPLPKGRPALLH
ncbi:hypothetical protein [Phenylobacterium sp.]|uniref:hypothetical protein n=1 Tax=Phenylobacterium sp. TaxID=1871053 RepID=UPI002613A5B4|nr:hypothetical protein [Phenylobacterium sp.]